MALGRRRRNTSRLWTWVSGLLLTYRVRTQIQVVTEATQEGLLHSRRGRSRSTPPRRHYAQHPPKNQPVDRIEPVPVEEPSQPERIEDRGLGDPAAALRPLHLELEPSPARHFHLGGVRQPADASGRVTTATGE